MSYELACDLVYESKIALTVRDTVDGQAYTIPHDEIRRTNFVRQHGGVRRGTIIVSDSFARKKGWV